MQSEVTTNMQWEKRKLKGEGNLNQRRTVCFQQRYIVVLDHKAE
jgi:hypothetical protein